MATVALWFSSARDQQRLADGDTSAEVAHPSDDLPGLSVREGLFSANFAMLALAGLMMLPLAVPILIFGAGMFDPLARGSLLMLAAASLLLVAIAPFAGGAALRAAREK